MMAFSDGKTSKKVFERLDIEKILTGNAEY